MPQFELKSVFKKMQNCIENPIFSQKNLDFGNKNYFLKKTTMLTHSTENLVKIAEIIFLRSLLLHRVIDVKKPEC